ncbi:MAG TPA: pantoate--beta-alanine ligase [Hanamia sp.]|nr:pantoate--beta-alanine ligase [Hanamia sp.]
MIVFKHFQDLHFHLISHYSSKVSVGFVPTMGALHAGHLSLIEQCKKQAGITVCSIFVNPVQFNNSEDFKKYPITIEKDISFLEEHGCDILFLPDEKEIYPDAASKDRHFDLGYLETILEGKFRPGHFQGVCLIVEKLLNLVNPDYLFIGQKDFQQCMVIKRLIDIMKKEIKVIVCPTLREKNGLAMSSRNLRFQPAEKELASQLYQSLQLIKENLTATNFSELKKNAMIHLENVGFKIEYLELAKAKNLELTQLYDSSEDHVILIAAFLNDVRLIDNILI